MEKPGFPDPMKVELQILECRGEKAPAGPHRAARPGAGRIRRPRRSDSGAA